MSVVNNGAITGRNLDSSSGANSAFTGKRLVANNCRLPTQINSSANWVNNCWTKHRSGPSGFPNGVYASFVNGYIATNQESDAFYEFDLITGILVNGKFTQGIFLGSGTATATLEVAWGKDTAFYDVAIPPNTDFWVTNRRAATDGGAAGTYQVLSSHAGQTFRQDGLIGGTSLAADYTLGVGIAYGAKVLAPIISAAGVITSIPIDPNNKGVNHSGGCTLATYFGGAQINTTGALIEGTTNWSGYVNSSGGGISSVTTLGGGTGFNPNNPPLCYVGGSGTAASGFGTPTASYGPFAIFGENDAPILSVLNIGDSIMAGYGSVDSLGDISGNYGLYERAYQNRCGVMTFAVSGTSLAGWLANSTQQRALLTYLEGLGLVIDKFVLGLGVNDWNSNANADALTAIQGYAASAITLVNAIYPDADAITTTIPPLTTTSDGGITTTNQTVWSVGSGTPNYAANGRVTNYNIAIRNGSGITGQKGFIDTAFLFADATVPSKWRVAGEFYLSSASGVVFANPETVGATANTMIHPSLNIGIPYAAANLDLRQLLEDDFTRNIEAPRESYVARPYEQGEFAYRKLAAASAVSLTTATAANVTNIVLSAGDWEVSGVISFVAASATCTNVTASTSRISATQGREEATASRIMTITTTSGTEGVVLPKTRYSVPSGSTMTIYAVATATFSAGTMTAYGTITAKRM